MKSSGTGGRRQSVLRLLRDAAEPVTIAAVATRLGVHVNTARFHLDALVADGLAAPVSAPRPSDGPGRPPRRFRAVPAMDPAGTRHYRMLAEVLAHGITSAEDGPAHAVAAGRAWGHAYGATTPGKVRSRRAAGDRLTTLLDDLGFAPEPHGRHAIGLRNCPFLEVARSAADVVCPLHLGLMRGALTAWEATLDVERLDRFVEPDLCLVHLSSPPEAKAEHATPSTNEPPT